MEEKLIVTGNAKAMVSRTNMEPIIVAGRVMLLLSFSGIVSCTGPSRPSQAQEQKTAKSLYLRCEQTECTMLSFEKAVPSDQMSVALTSIRTTGATAVPIKSFIVGDDGVPENITIPSAKIGEPDKQYFFRFSKGAETLYLCPDIGCLAEADGYARKTESTIRTIFHKVTNEKVAEQEITKALSNDRSAR